MNKNKITMIAMLFTIALLAGVAVGAAKSSANFQISSEVIASGGSSSSSSSFKSPANTVGQTGSGTSSSTSFSNKAGFVPTLALSDAIAITFPTLGLQLPRNNTHTISWNISGVTGPTVNILVLSPSTLEILILNAPNTGSNNIFFPADMLPGTGYTIIVVATIDAAIADTSDAFEVIAGNASVNLDWQNLE